MRRVRARLAVRRARARRQGMRRRPRLRAPVRRPHAQRLAPLLPVQRMRQSCAAGGVSRAAPAGAARAHAALTLAAQHRRRPLAVHCERFARDAAPPANSMVPDAVRPLDSMQAFVARAFVTPVLVEYRTTGTTAVQV